MHPALNTILHKYILSEMFCFSTARMSDVKEHVMCLLGTVNSCCSNFSITSFDDQFLQEHVRSVAICDLDLLDLKVGEVSGCPDTRRQWQSKLIWIFWHSFMQRPVYPSFGRVEIWVDGW